MSNRNSITTSPDIIPRRLLTLIVFDFRKYLAGANRTENRSSLSI